MGVEQCFSTHSGLHRQCRGKSKARYQSIWTTKTLACLKITVGVAAVCSFYFVAQLNQEFEQQCDLPHQFYASRIVKSRWGSVILCLVWVVMCVGWRVRTGSETSMWGFGRVGVHWWLEWWSSSCPDPRICWQTGTRSDLHKPTQGSHLSSFKSSKQELTMDWYLWF